MEEMDSKRLRIDSLKSCLDAVDHQPRSTLLPTTATRPPQPHPTTRIAPAPVSSNNNNGDGHHNLKDAFLLAFTK